MAILSKDDILKAEDLPRELVEVPEWGGSVWVRAMTGDEKNFYEEAGLRVSGKSASFSLENAYARAAALSICDDKGQRLFTEAEAAALGKKSGAALERIFKVAAKLSKLTAGEAAELEKNSAPAPASASG